MADVKYVEGGSGVELKMFLRHCTCMLLNEGYLPRELSHNEEGLVGIHIS